MTYDERKDYTHRKIKVYTYLVTLRKFGGEFQVRTVQMQTVYNLGLYSESSAAWHLQADNPGLFQEDEVVLSWDLLKIETVYCKLLLRDFFNVATKGE